MMNFLILFLVLWKLRSCQSKENSILILSAPRSGSSFVGAVFNRLPNVFYLFEPCRAFENEGNPCLEILTRSLNCKLTLHDTNQLFGDRSAAFKSVVMKSLIDQPIEETTRHERFLSLCTNARYVVVKEVRLRTLLSPTLFPSFNQLLHQVKLVYLYRHPFAVIHSQLQLPAFCAPSSEKQSPSTKNINQNNNNQQIAKKFPNHYGNASSTLSMNEESRTQECSHKVCEYISSMLTTLKHVFPNGIHPHSKNNKNQINNDLNEQISFLPEHHDDHSSSLNSVIQSQLYSSYHYLKYEDIAENPVETFKNLFLQLSNLTTTSNSSSDVVNDDLFTSYKQQKSEKRLRLVPSVQAWLKSTTTARHEDGPYQTKRDAQKTAQAWMEDFDQSQRRIAFRLITPPLQEKQT